jgi:DNA-directed RNA polymerase specialized sigma24 family protein
MTPADRFPRAKSPVTRAADADGPGTEARRRVDPATSRSVPDHPTCQTTRQITVEAAAVLGLSVEATKSRLHRARALLRERLLRGGYGR